MEIKEFQEKLAALCQEGLKNDRKLNGLQIKEFFSEMDLNKEQRVLLFHYLKEQGIRVEGLEEETAEVKTAEKKATACKKENPCLTEEDKAYLKGYLKEVKRFHGEDSRMARMMPLAATFAADMLRDGMNLQDLIQEANISLLTILAEAEEDVSEETLIEELRAGVKKAVEAADDQSFGDDCLVARVQNLDNVMKELTDGEEGEPKFSVEELAIMLDMDVDEMKDIIRLTGEY